MVCGDCAIWDSVAGNEQQHRVKCEDKYEEEAGKRMKYRSKRNKFKGKYE
jgi:hypothetical protein